MKLKLRLGIFFIFLTACTFGQVRFGIKAGINLSKVKTTNLPEPNGLEYKSIIGYAFGPSVKIGLGDRLNLNSDFLFSRRGYEIFDYTTAINYLEIPVLLSYSVIKNLDIELGPDLALKLFVNSNQPSLKPSEFKTFDLGASTGLSYTFKERVILSARYYYGLTSIVALYRTSEATESKTFNRVFQLSLGYRIASIDVKQRN